MTRIAGIACRQAREVVLLTAVKITGHGPACTADSSHGVGGVCNVEIIGMGTRRAIATGRWCRQLLCTTSKSARPLAASSISSCR